MDYISTNRANKCVKSCLKDQPSETGLHELPGTRVARATDPRLWIYPSIEDPDLIPMPVFCLLPV